MHIGHSNEENQEQISISLKKKPIKRMNEEICCITNEGKTAKIKWEKDDSAFLQALYSVYNETGQFFFHTLLANVFKKKINQFCYKL